MVKRAKLTLESDSVENNLSQPVDAPPEATPDPKEPSETVPLAYVKRSGIFKTVLLAGLTIASIVIFKRKIF